MKTLTPLLLLFFLLLPQAIAQETEDTSNLKPAYYEVNDYVEENEKCLACHAEPKFTIIDTFWNRTITEHMCPDRIIEREKYYSAVHNAFACNDCHSTEFEEFPHPLDSRIEENYLCMDCHGYDESFAHYHFEEIEVEFTESIHNIEEFTCWKCHDPHSYRAFMRNANDLREAILYDNEMCLNCHANFDHFMLLTDRSEINVLERHDWLPNQTRHFLNVRCIECHTEVNDSILIAHKILPSEQAVKLCTECHSTDSRLLHTLYKFQSLEVRQAGLMNGVIVNTPFVIGANQNVFLNRLSFVILGIILLIIFVHIAFRIKSQKNTLA